MPLKYESQLSLLKNCPPNSASAQDRDSWRFVFHPMGPESFVPVELLNKARHRTGDPRTKRKECCSGWGLSMFDTSAQAMAKFSKLASSIPNIKARVGTHLAFARLTALHGISTASNADGHFDLHPESNAVLHGVFSIQSVLP